MDEVFLIFLISKTNYGNECFVTKIVLTYCEKKTSSITRTILDLYIPMLAAVRTASKVWHKQEQQQEIGKARVVKYRSRNPAIKLYKLCYPQVFSIFIRDTNSILTPVNKVHRALLVSQDDSKLKSETIFGYFFFIPPIVLKQLFSFYFNGVEEGVAALYSGFPLLHTYYISIQVKALLAPTQFPSDRERVWKVGGKPWTASRMKASNSQWSEEMKAQKSCLLISLYSDL